METEALRKNSTTFVDNMRLPVHRWFRYSAGFSADWVRHVIETSTLATPRVFDPFAGSGTTLIAAQDAGVESWGVESHPFVFRVARAKLARTADPDDFRKFARNVLSAARKLSDSKQNGYPPLIHKCYTAESLSALDRLRRAFTARVDDSDLSQLTWLALVGILRKTSHVGTANWQYVLPNKSKSNAVEPFQAFDGQIDTMYRDMLTCKATLPSAVLTQDDARTCATVGDAVANLVITSPPYPNNYDYADATRLEMSFLQEISGWGCLKTAVRQHLVRSCSQHETSATVDIDAVLADPLLQPIAGEIRKVCDELAEIRLTKGGKKAYYLMIACYFLDLAKVWRSLRRVCDSPSSVCFVVGDSAPYGIYVPVIEWLGRLAVAAGFKSFEFSKTRDRNVKWKNRKHRVPLCEGQLWVKG